ncbi:MAG: DegV family protein [Candidatus Paceibacterota bacterium]
MKNTTIILGQSAPMTEELMQRFGFIIAPFKLDWPEGENLSGDMFTKMREAKKQGVKTTPKTSQPSMGLFKKAFDEALQKSQYVLAITISSVISGTYNSAVQAKKMFNEEDQKRIFIVDSYNADAAETLLAIKAGEMDEQGVGIEEIAQKLEKQKNQTKLFGMLEGPYWLEAGGRISHTVAVLMEQMQKLGMRPLLSMIDGAVKPANLKMQAKDTANALFKQVESIIKEPLAQGKKVSIAISHADNPTEAKSLEELFAKNYPQAKIEFTAAMGPVIGAHVGPGALICCTVQD